MSDEPGVYANEVTRSGRRTFAARTYSIEVRDDSMHLKDNPDHIAKVVRVPDELAKALAHMSLHQIDLQFAVECLDELDRLGYPDTGPDITRQALWHSALVATYKCFGRSGARSSLDAEAIYPDDAQRETYKYWRNLRNKSIVHDDNDVSQSHVVAVLRQPGAEPKVHELLTLSCRAIGLCGEHHEAARSRGHRERVGSGRDGQAQAPSVAALNGMSYQYLDALPPVQIDFATDDTVGLTRTTPAK